MRACVFLLAGLISAGPAVAAMPKPFITRMSDRPPATVEVAAKRLTMDQIAKMSRPSHPRRVIPGRRELR